MKFFRRELFWVLFLGILALFINNAPTVNRFLAAPKGTIYNGTEFWTEDHSIYAGHFKEGAKGIWLVHDKHTSESHRGFILRREYIFWGFLTGNILSFSPPLIYHSARLFGGIVLVFLIYFFISKVFKTKFLRIITFFSVLYLAGIPKINLQAANKIDLFIPWLTEIDPAIRFSVLWHYLIGGICFIGVILAFWKHLFTSGESIRPLPRCFKKMSFWLAVVLGGFGGLAHPSTLATLYFTFGFYLAFLLILVFLKRFEWKKWLVRFYFVMGFIIFTLPVVFILKIETARFPWNVIAGWDKTTTMLPFWPFVFTLGPIVFWTVLGTFRLIIRSLKRGVDLETDRLWLVFCWGLSSFLLIYGLWVFMDINKIRFAQNPFYVSLAIMTIYGLGWLAGWLKKIVGRSKNHIVGFIIFICFLIGLPIYIYGVKREFTKFPAEEGLIYSKKTWLEGMYWLDKNTKPEDVVLASYMASVLIPGFSGNTVYYGHSWSTIDFSKKADLMNRFFQGKMNKNEVKEFLLKGNIDYIFYSWQEASYGGNIDKYGQLLRLVHQWKEGKIYRVNF